jgi:hypothetical protein
MRFRDSRFHFSPQNSPMVPRSNSLDKSRRVVGPDAEASCGVKLGAQRPPMEYSVRERTYAPTGKPPGSQSTVGLQECSFFPRRVDPALWAMDLSGTDSVQFCRWNLVASMRARRGERRSHFCEIDLPTGGHSGILYPSELAVSPRSLNARSDD